MCGQNSPYQSSGEKINLSKWYQENMKQTTLKLTGVAGTRAAGLDPEGGGGGSLGMGGRKPSGAGSGGLLVSALRNSGLNIPDQ